MKKILIIEDQEEDFIKMCSLLGNTYDVLPNNFKEMSACVEYPKETGKDIVTFAIQQIEENYRDLKLVLCDVKLGKNKRGGNQVVNGIREHKIFGSPNWTSLVPIIAITHYANRQESILDAGADFTLLKEEIEKIEDVFLALIDNNMKAFERRLESLFPQTLKDEIKDFRKNHANEKTAFIMTSFAEEHQSTINQIIKVLKKHKITPCLANKEGGENHDYLWPNIEVFIHGCDFGIGIYADDSILKGGNIINGEEQYKEHFKRIRINPNMSQEVGYMLGLQKKVCILKDIKLDKLPSDLAGKIYVEYDGDNDNDLEEQLGEWLTNKILTKY